jgi:tetratricopeptide (TPR) repeat protein
MRNFTILLFLLLFSLAAFAQKPKSIKKPDNSSKPANSSKPTGSEKEEFEKAAAKSNAAEKIKALQKFNLDFPNSAEKNKALELIAETRAQIADEKLRSGDVEGGVELFKLAVKDAPATISDKLFTEVILQIPNNLFFRGQRLAAIEIAQSIEKKIDGNAKQVLGLAAFYLSIESADEAKRLAEKAIEIEPTQPAAYQTLGIANRLNFNLEEAANAYSKALEFAPDSIVSKRSLAEMRRATGNSAQAISLYREILAKDAADKPAQTGLILALFDNGQKAEAEAEMTKSLVQNPSNLILLVGASYWYAAQGNSAKAIELAQKALAVEPRYIWAYIALSRGFLQENRLMEAERALLAARNYGNFPTLDYELAAVRLAAGFYREAAQEMAKSFTVKNDAVNTKLGGRVEKQAKNFIELLAPERRASIFEPLAADNLDNAQKLKALLDFYQKLESPDAADAEIIEATDKFVGGDDKMKLHRQLFAADRLLEKKKVLPKVTELMRAAIGGVDAALSVPNPASAVLADQLFESRSLAISRNEIVVVPDVPRQTLSNILRGRIEEISGWALYQDNKPGEAVVRLKRAVSVLPEKSAWWRSGMWRLGAALQTDGKPKEALDAYLKGYSTETPDTAKRIIIEGLYKEINGSLDGLDAKIGAKPETASINSIIQTATATQTTEKSVSVPETAPKAAEATPTVVENKPASEASATNEKSSIPTENSPATEPKNEAKQSNEPKKPLAENESEKGQKPLFEPVIITVPKINVPAKAKFDAVNTQTEETPGCRIIASQENISLVNNGGNLGILVGFEDATLDTKEIKAISSSAKDLEIVFEPKIGSTSKKAFFVIKSISEIKGIYTVTFEATCGRKDITVKVR